MQLSKIFYSTLPIAIIPMSLIVILGLLAGLSTAIAPMWVATFALGIPAVLLSFLPRTRYWALLVVFSMAPFVPFLKAITGIRYGPLALDAGLGILVVSLLADGVTQHRPIRLTRVETGLLLYMAIGFIQLFNPLGPGLIEALEGYRILVWQVVGYFLGHRLIQNKMQVRCLIIALNIVVIVVAIYGVKQFFLPSDIDYRLVDMTRASPITYLAMDQSRAFSTMSSPFHLAYLLVTMLLLNFCLVGLTKRKWLWAIQTGIMFLALLLTIIRSGWVGLLVGLVILGALKSIERKNLTSSLLLFFTGFLFYFLVGYLLTVFQPDIALTERFKSLSYLNEEEHYQDRINSWPEVILPAIADNPLGYGVGSDTATDFAIFYSHNGYFYIAIEMGITALLLSIGIIAFSLLKLFISHTKLKDPYLRGIACWTLVVWGAMLVMGAFGALLEVYPVSLYLWFLLGLASKLTQLDSQEKSMSVIPAVVEARLV